MENDNISDLGITPILIKIHNHDDEILIIRSFEFGESSPQDKYTFNSPNQSIFYVGPVYRDISKDEFASIPDPDLNGTILCSYIHLNWPDRYKQFPIIDISNNRELPVSFVKKNGKDALKIEGSYRENIINSVHTNK